MTDRQITYTVVGAASVISLAAWVALIAIPAWTSYWRLRDRLVAVALSVYVLAGFVMVGAGVGAAVLWYYDRL
ncbi:MAG TPA: hypothetical protein VH276_12095 [Solirubrobacteraceae bacterium]|jgi:hypothetical protein|nr:hypothetical protein [Solirubrobacteraceae bacterium]